MISENIKRPQSSVAFGFGFNETTYRVKGEVLIKLDDQEIKVNNVYTLDGSLLASILFSGLYPTRSPITMLAVGTGATGTSLVPSVADQRQRRLNTEIARKEFASVLFRNPTTFAVSAIPTNVVDFTTVYNEGEAVGALNEMGLVSPYDASPLSNYPLLDGNGDPVSFPDYDTTLDVTNYDILINYLTFPVINKPSNSVLAITWRLTF
jgi:hypothetical protein